MSRPVHEIKMITIQLNIEFVSSPFLSLGPPPYAAVGLASLSLCTEQE